MKKLRIIYQYADIYFKFIYLIHILISANNLLYDTWANHISSILTLGCAAVVVCGRIVRYQKQKSYPLLVYYLLFLSSFLVSMILNIKYGVYYNFKILIWMTIQFTALYIFDGNMKKEQVLWQLKQLMRVLVGFVSIVNLIGIIMAFLQFITYRILSKEVYFLIGFAPWGRLYGLHTDPNYSAAVAVVAVIFALYLYKTELVSWLRKFAIMSIVIQMIALAMGASRTGLVAMLVAIFIYSFFTLRLKKINVAKAVMQSLSVVLLVLVIERGVVSGFNTMMVIKSQLVSKQSQTTSQQVIAINRKTELSQDISNRRFSLWKDAIEIAQTRQLFGVTFGNFVSYAKQEKPNSYMLTNDLTVFNAFHNMGMDLLASQGIVGVVIFLCLIFASLRFLYRRYHTLSESEFLLCACLFSTCVALVLASMFTSCILYVNNQVTVIFWMLWGFLIYFMSHSENCYE